MNGLISAVYSLLKNRGTFFQEFKESGTFIAPKTGWYEIDGCGGGASGAIGTNLSGGSGAGCKGFRLYLIKGQSVPVVIGAGGVWISGSNIASGGDTSFGSYITLPGAYWSDPYSFGGASETIGSARASVDLGFIISGAWGASGSSPTPGRGTYPAGANGSDSNYRGGAGGAFGKGGDGNSSGVGQSAAANSGAGGGGGTAGGGNGGSGRLIIREAC